MKLKKGDKIICIINADYFGDSCSYLTIGKEYTINLTQRYYGNSTRYVVIDDNNDNRVVGIKNFISSRKLKIEKIQDEIRNR